MHRTSFKRHSGHQLGKKVTHCRIIEWQVMNTAETILDPHNGGTLVCWPAWQFNCHAAPKLHPSLPHRCSWGFVMRVPSPLLDESKESMCGPRLKLSPIFKILVLVKESVRDLKCLHSLFKQYCPYKILASKSVTTAFQDPWRSC